MTRFNPDNFTQSVYDSICFIFALIRLS